MSISFSCVGVIHCYRCLIVEVIGFHVLSVLTVLLVVPGVSTRAVWLRWLPIQLLLMTTLSGISVAGVVS